MTALDLVRRIRANPKGSDFQDVKHVEEFVKTRIEFERFERMTKALQLIQTMDSPDFGRKIEKGEFHDVASKGLE